MGENGRELVLDMLLEMERQKEYSHRLVRAVLDKYDYLDPKEKAFIKRLSEGTVERKLEMDYYLNHFSKLPVNKMRPLIRCLLRMSVYQLLYMDMVPDNAVCDESCKLAAKRGFRSLKGFVNGILRTIARNRDKLPVPDREKDPVGFFSVKYSVPEWLVRLWMEEYGKEAAAVLLDGLLAVHPVSLRFSSSVSCQEQETLQNRMEEQGACDTLQVGLRVSSPRFWERVDPNAIYDSLATVAPNGERYALMGGMIPRQYAVEDEWGNVEIRGYLLNGAELCDWDLWYREFAVCLPAEGWEPGGLVTLELNSQAGGISLSVPVTRRVVVP